MTELAALSIFQLSQAIMTFRLSLLISISLARRSQHQLLQRCEINQIHIPSFIYHKFKKIVF